MRLVIAAADGRRNLAGIDIDNHIDIHPFAGIDDGLHDGRGVCGKRDIDFCDKDGNNCSKEKKIFPGAYNKDEFIQNIEKLRNEKKIVKVELLVDFADMNKNDYSNWIEPNKELFIDFYFLINIFN